MAVAQRSTDNIVHIRPDMSIPEVRPPELRNEGGWARSYRRIWHQDSVCRTFEEAAVWCYLFTMAEYVARCRQVGGHEFYVERGQLVTSYSRLQEYFGWNRGKLRHFLDRLVAAKRISVSPLCSVVPPIRGRSAANSRPIGIRISIMNYDTYQNTDAGVQPIGSQQPDTSKEVRANKGRESESRTDSELRDRASPRDTVSEDSSPARAGGSSRKRSSDGDLEAEFEAFWQGWTYPGSKRGKGDARKAYRQVRKAGASAEQILEGLRRYMRQCDERQPEIGFVKHPGSWLRAERWADEAPGKANGYRVLTEREIDLCQYDGPGWYTSERKAKLEALGLYPMPEWARKQVLG